jgi:hypothetical protein
MKRFAALVGVLGILALAVPGAAAASSTCQAYNPQLCSSVGSSNTSNGSGSGTSPGTTSAGTLPFTGLDVVLLVAGGGTLLAAGFVVRRLSRRLN